MGKARQKDGGQKNTTFFCPPFFCLSNRKRRTVLKHDEIFASFVFASFVIFVVHSFSYTTPIRPALVLARVPEREDHERRERNEMLTGLRDLNVAKTSK